MNFVIVPNLPAMSVSLVVIDGRVTPTIENSLEMSGIRIIKTERHPDLYEAVAFHPDMMLHHIGGNRIIYAPHTSDYLLQQLESQDFELVMGSKKLSSAYPEDIAYNGARVGNLFFHNLKFTDEILLNELTASGVELVHVNQGYAKCAVAVIDETCILTSDTGIACAAKDKGISVLLVPPQKSICLPGLDYGFIGGSSGMLDKSHWAVFGNAESLEMFSSVYKFLQQKNIEIISLSVDVIMDYGSLLTLKT